MDYTSNDFHRRDAETQRQADNEFFSSCFRSLYSLRLRVSAVNYLAFIRQRTFSASIMLVSLLFIIALAFTFVHTRIAYGSDQDLRKLNQFVQNNSNSPSMKIFREGRDMIEQEQWGKAAEKFNSFIAKYPKDKDVDAALYWLAYAFKRDGKFREAASNLDRLTREFPRSSWSDEAKAMIVEISPQLGENGAPERVLQNKGEDEELKVVALQSLFEANQERAIAYVAEILKPNSTASHNLKEAAVSLLGSHGGKQAIPLLLDVARNQPDQELRRIAIHRIGEEGGDAVVDDLARLYDSERDKEVKQQILHSFSEMRSPRARAKLLEVARSDGDAELRQNAIHWLGERDDDASLIDDLMSIYNADRTTEIRQQILHAFSEMRDPRAQAKLLEIARSGNDTELRESAIHWLGEKNNEAMIDELMKIYESDRNLEIRGRILHAFSEMRSPRARAKLLEIARSGDDPELRRAAIHWLGEKNDAQAMEMLISLYDSEKDFEVKQSLLHAFSESRQKNALHKLMDVARLDSNVELRKNAVHWLGESKDPEALKFLEDLLK